MEAQLEGVSKQFDSIISIIDDHREKLFQAESIGTIKIDYDKRYSILIE